MTTPDEPPFTAEAAAYLADCARLGGRLDRRYHPTEDGAVKLTPHRHHHDREADQTAEEHIRAAYRAAVAAPRQESGTSGTCGTPAGQANQNGFRVPTEVPEPPEPFPPARARRQEEPAMRDDPRAALAAAALNAAARGWHVFPVRPGDKRPAYPDHTADRCAGTDPRCRDGHQGWEPRATTDPARITRAWSAAPFNVGIATGPSGLIVIDLDVPKPGEEPPARWALPGIGDGADVLAVLAEEAGEAFPWETFTVRTRRGGLHLYFEAPAGAELRCTSGALGWLIDTRAGGGYVVGPGSTVSLPDGTGRYEVIYDRAPALLPAWLAALLTAPRPAAPSLECRSSGDSPVRALGAYARAALQRESDAVRGAATGGRTHVLNKAAYHLGQLVAVGALDDATAETALYEAASAHFAADQPVTPAEARASIRGGLAAGKRHPRRTAA